MTKKHNFMSTELTALIQTLRQVYFRVSSSLLQRRMDRTKLGGGDTSNINIAEPLRKHIDILTAQKSSDSGYEVDEAGALHPENTDISDTARATGEATTRGGWSFNDLATWIKKRGGLPVMEPHIAEKLKNSARQHINEALRLARQGKNEAAKVHAELAENAVKTAAHYMSEDAYHDFKMYVLDRLDSIIKKYS